MHSASCKVLSTDIATRNKSLLPLGARKQQVLCLGATCTKLAMSSASASGRLIKIKGSCCPQGRGANTEWLAAKMRHAMRWRDSPKGPK